MAKTNAKSGKRAGTGWLSRQIAVAQKSLNGRPEQIRRIAHFEGGGHADLPETTKRRDRS